MAGRPSTYDPMFCEMILDYFEKKANDAHRELPGTSTHTVSEKGISQKEEVRKICAELPTLQGFARSINVSSQTLWKWSQDHEDFAEAYARAKDVQQQLLVDRGLTRQYDPTAFVFVMQNISDWRARLDTKNEHTGADGNALQFVVSTVKRD